MDKSTAIVLTNGWLDTIQAKTCHGLLRGTDRFELLGIIDQKQAGRDSGEVLDGRANGIAVFASTGDYLAAQQRKPQYLVVGVVFSGGALPDDFRGELVYALRQGISVICGLHSFLGDDPELRQAAQAGGARIIDVRKPRPTAELRFWSGEIYSVKTPRIAVLGTDVATGKRTTCRFIMEMCRANGIAAEMIYTGQTGWMQGYPHGFIFDATVNDFISGELERVIVDCDRQLHPDLILLEGQSSLRNPSGPCGSEFIISGNVKGVVLQHIPGRKHYKGVKPPHGRMKDVPSEIALIGHLGAETLAVTLNEMGSEESEIHDYQQRLQAEIGLPVVRPLKEGVDALLPPIRDYLARHASLLNE